MHAMKKGHVRTQLEVVPCFGGKPRSEPSSELTLAQNPDLRLSASKTVRKYIYVKSPSLWILLWLPEPETIYIGVCVCVYYLYFINENTVLPAFMIVEDCMK